MILTHVEVTKPSNSDTGTGNESVGTFRQTLGKYKRFILKNSNSEGTKSKKAIKVPNTSYGCELILNINIAREETLKYTSESQFINDFPGSEQEFSKFLADNKGHIMNQPESAGTKLALNHISKHRAKKKKNTDVHKKFIVDRRNVVNQSHLNGSALNNTSRYTALTVLKRKPNPLIDRRKKKKYKFENKDRGSPKPDIDSLSRHKGSSVTTNV